jgi:hypothetical protein
MYRLIRWSAVFLSLGAGCEEPEENGLNVVPKSEWGRADRIRILVPGFPEPAEPIGFTVLVEDMTGVEFEETDEMPGAISMVPIRDEPLDGGELGEFSSGTCAPWVSFSPTSTIHFSHMLGHSIGLEHHDEPCNFMYAPNGRLEPECTAEFFADDEQIDELRAYAWALENVCDEWR